MPEENEKNTPETEGLEPEGLKPEIEEKVKVPPVVTGEGETYETLSKKKGWKDYDAAAKSYSELESEHGKIIGENKQLREYGQQVYNYLLDVEKTKEAPKEEKEKLKEVLESNPEMVEVIKEMLGTELNPLKKGQEKLVLAQALSDMKLDKKNFPYMSDELEQKMTGIFRANKNLQPTRETVHLLYLAAVGHSVSGISAKSKKAGIDEAYKNIGEKMGTYSEGEQGSEAGKTSSEDEELIDAIINAGGKSLKI